ncbi:MAG: TIGR00725 family protein [Thermoanaerobaculia bacterium]|nr:TIGR00725 family protein [Thermoanaerobaculia bacterium]
MSGSLQIAVCGAGECDDHVSEVAFQVGCGLAVAGAILVCGGRGGVMAAACRGARSAGGITLGILPGVSDADSRPNNYLTATIHTGIGQGRNLAVALSGHAAIAIAGGWGTLSEISLALKHGVPVVSLESWRPGREIRRAHDAPTDPNLHVAHTAEEAVELALHLAGHRHGSRPP